MSRWSIRDFDAVELEQVRRRYEPQGYRDIRWLNGYCVGLPPGKIADVVLYP